MRKGKYNRILQQDSSLHVGCKQNILSDLKLGVFYTGRK